MSQSEDTWGVTSQKIVSALTLKIEVTAALHISLSAKTHSHGGSSCTYTETQEFQCSGSAV